MRVIFLDIDGVLNSSRTAVAYQQILQRDLDPVAVRMLYRMVMTAQASMVISSTWRMDPNYETTIWGCLRAAGWPVSFYEWLDAGHRETPIIGATDRRGPTRGHEIQRWLDDNPQYDDYLILDDDSDMLQSQMDRFINCDHKVGLSWDNWSQIRSIWPEVDNRNYGPWEQEPDGPREFENE